MICLVLGGGSGQLNIIKRLKKLGHEVWTADLNPEAPGVKISDYWLNASSFEPGKIISLLKNMDSRPGAVLTGGTDQPVLTAALICEKFKIKALHSPQLALAVTNKRIMKNIFKIHQLPQAEFNILGPTDTSASIKNLKYPLVIKPSDSQGQRGVVKINSAEEFDALFPVTLKFSRESCVIAEEYYKSDEITVSGWIYNGKTEIFSITDRLTFNEEPHIGICFAHNWPSKYLPEKEKEITDLTVRITAAFGIKNGPIYFQFLYGDRGPVINEIACRLGGAYEDEFMPFICGRDIIELLIKSSLPGRWPEYTPAVRENNLFLSSMLLFAKEGKIAKQEGFERLESFEWFKAGKFLLKNGTEIKNRENSTQRCAYAVISGRTASEANNNLSKVFDCLKIYDTQGNNLLINTSEKNFFPEA
jgi:biotin carboxylase